MSFGNLSLIILSLKTKLPYSSGIFFAIAKTSLSFTDIRLNILKIEIKKGALEVLSSKAPLLYVR